MLITTTSPAFSGLRVTIGKSIGSIRAGRDKVPFRDINITVDHSVDGIQIGRKRYPCPNANNIKRTDHLTLPALLRLAHIACVPTKWITYAGNATEAMYIGPVTFTARVPLEKAGQ